MSGSDPVWEEPGKQAEKVYEFTASDYESACDQWNERVHAEAAQQYQSSGDGKQFEADIGSVVKPAENPTV